MMLDTTMQAAIAFLFTTAIGAVGVVFTRLSNRADASDNRVFTMLEKQFSEQERRKDLFDSLAKTIDGNTQVSRELKETLNREMQSLRAEIQRIRPTA